MKKSAEPSVYAGTVSISLLGGFSLEMNGATLTDDINRSLKLWSVLAYLVLHRNRPVPQSEFIELFWPEDNSSNPVNALKTLLYRIRAMLEPLFGPEVQPILAQRGAYSWNPAVTCELDADRFEALCFQASNEDLPDAARIELYRQAVALYQGDLLPKLNHQMWLIPLSVHYHTLYLEAVKALAALLDRAELFDEMQLVCQRASSLDNLDEGLHTLIVRSLLRQGKDAAALDHYEKATDLLYRNLGVRPSEELRALYTEIMATEKTLETDLGAIMADLKETAARPGAFVCEYGFFPGGLPAGGPQGRPQRRLRPSVPDHRLPAGRERTAPQGPLLHHGAASGRAGPQPAQGRRGFQIQRGSVCRHAARRQL